MTVPRLGLVHDPRFQEHAPEGSHPERPERLASIEKAIEPLRECWLDVEPCRADDGEILRVHGAGLLNALREVEGRRAQLDPDTYSAPRSLEIARLAAGSAANLSRRVARRELESGMALVRPPGHHAEKNQAMGFCLLNSVAIAASALRTHEGVERIAIVDWDVHHGNGTQHLFEADPNVLFLSTHQFPFYPGTGDLGEKGVGPGEGATVNLPLPAGSDDATYLAAFDSILIPVLQEFRPEMILVSAGFDAHAQDPLAGMQVTTAGFASMAARVRAVADDLCDGRLVLSLEGGYDLDALAESVAAVVTVLASSEIPKESLESSTSGVGSNIARLREAHRSEWGALR